jgi:hypothetical protein
MSKGMQRRRRRRVHHTASGTTPFKDDWGKHGAGRRAQPPAEGSKVKVDATHESKQGNAARGGGGRGLEQEGEEARKGGREA